MIPATGQTAPQFKVSVATRAFMPAPGRIASPSPSDLRFQVCERTPGPALFRREGKKAGRRTVVGHGGTHFSGVMTTRRMPAICGPICENWTAMVGRFELNRDE